MNCISCVEYEYESRRCKLSDNKIQNERTNRFCSGYKQIESLQEKYIQPMERIKELEAEIAKFIPIKKLTPECLLNTAVKTELSRANSLYPKFHSAHEAESVLREELEECIDEMNDLQETFKYLWDNIKSNDIGQQQSALNQLKQCAENLSVEVNQFRAMLEKAQVFYDKDGVK